MSVFLGRCSTLRAAACGWIVELGYGACACARWTREVSFDVFVVCWSRDQEHTPLSRTFRRDDRSVWSVDRLTYRADTQEFRCRRCKMMVGPPLWGGSHRNHCPFCLYSRHVDGRSPGDRASTCGGLMEPVGSFVRGKGEHVVVHRCLGCGFQRHNRIAGDDDYERVLSLPSLKPRITK